MLKVYVCSNVGLFWIFPRNVGFCYRVSQKKKRPNVATLKSVIHSYILCKYILIKVKFLHMYDYID